MIKFTSRDNGVTFAVRVQPRASRSGVAGELDGALKILLTSPPVDGEANDELVRVLAKLFDVSRAQVEIISGKASKNKLVCISGISAELLEMALRKEEIKRQK